MSRQDQINAELASQVSIKQQSSILQLKNSLQTTGDLHLLTDDEAIVIGGGVYETAESERKTLENICLGIAGLGVFIGIFGQSVGPPLVGIIVAFLIYHFAWKSKKEKLGMIMLGTMIQTAERKKAQLEISGAEKPAATTAQTSPSSTFDVPPQDG